MNMTMRAFGVVLLAVLGCGCTHTVYEGEKRPESELVVLRIREADLDHPTNSLKGFAGLGLFYWGMWQLTLMNVDGAPIYDIGFGHTDTLPGAHVVTARAEQGAPGMLGFSAAWSCHATLQIDVPAGSYQVRFTRQGRSGIPG